MAMAVARIIDFLSMAARSGRFFAFPYLYERIFMGDDHI
jgi:hypothetical protein